MKKIFIQCMALVLFWELGIQAYAGQEWQERKTLHFSVLYKSAPSDFIKNVEDMAERCYDEIIRDLGFRISFKDIYSNRIKIYIYNDLKDFKANTDEMDGIHGVAYFRKRTIRTFPSAHGFFDSTLPHELGHIIFREFVGYQTHIPLWLDEGVAMFQEKAKRWGAHEKVREAIQQKRFMSLDELAHKRLRDFKNREERRLFYSQSASLVYFMIKELGGYRFLSFCNHLRDGATFNKAFKQAYRQFDDLRDLEKAWIDYVEGQ